jgi:phage gpG-like protein
MSSIKVDTKEFDRFVVLMDGYPSKVNTKVSEAVRESTFNIEKYAKDNLTKNGSVDTGLLRNSINSKITLLTGTVSTNTKYARIVEEGSKPHIIRPKKKKFLYWNGASHPVKQVKHPGSKPKPYMIPALEKEEPNFIKALTNAVDLP